ncbi:MAG: hypothetical protein ACNA8W_11145 [Bradymonadaceae bacterium]
MYRRLAPGLAMAILLWACNLHFDVDSVSPPDATHPDSQLPDTGRDSAIPDTHHNPPIPDAAHDDIDADAGPMDTARHDTDSNHVAPPSCDELGLHDCEGKCRDIDSDPYFCGGCQTPCHPTETCEQGSCKATTCPFDPGPLPGELSPEECDPVLRTGCDFEIEACQLLYFPNRNQFGTVCVSRDALTMDVEVGDTCEAAADCVDDTSCVSWENPDPRRRVCSQICHLETSQGCGDDEYCVNPFPRQTSSAGGESDVLRGLGFCTPRCSPTELDACPSGQACTPDPDFGSYACHANFRCLRSGGSSGKSAMSPCDRTQLHQNGCPTGLICMPHETDDRCMRLCSHDAQCDEGSCTFAEAPSGFLTFCKP